MQVVDLRLKLNRKWAEIPQVYFSSNQSLNSVAICWTKLPCTLININFIILFLEKKPLLNNQEKHYWFDCNFLLNIIIHTAYKMKIVNQNIALILKLVDSKFFYLLTKRRKPHVHSNQIIIIIKPTTHRLVQNLYFNFLGVKISFTLLFFI